MVSRQLSFSQLAGSDITTSESRARKRVQTPFHAMRPSLASRPVPRISIPTGRECVTPRDSTLYHSQSERSGARQLSTPHCQQSERGGMLRMGERTSPYDCSTPDQALSTQHQPSGISLPQHVMSRSREGVRRGNMVQSSSSPGLAMAGSPACRQRFPSRSGSDHQRKSGRAQSSVCCSAHVKSADRLPPDFLSNQQINRSLDHVAPSSFQHQISFVVDAADDKDDHLVRSTLEEPEDGSEMIDLDPALSRVEKLKPLQRVPPRLRARVADGCQIHSAAGSSTAFMIVHR